MLTWNKFLSSLFPHGLSQMESRRSVAFPPTLAPLVSLAYSYVRPVRARVKEHRNNARFTCTSWHSNISCLQNDSLTVLTVSMYLRITSKWQITVSVFRFSNMWNRSMTVWSSVSATLIICRSRSWTTQQYVMSASTFITFIYTNSGAFCLVSLDAAHTTRNLYAIRNRSTGMHMKSGGTRFPGQSHLLTCRRDWIMCWSVSERLGSLTLVDFAGQKRQ